MSVPVDVEGGLKEIKELESFLQFQSTLRYLKDGRYINNEVKTHNEPLNLLDRLDDISQSIRNGAYQNDFVIQLAIPNLFRSTGDFHLRFQPDVLEIFLFVRPESQLIFVPKDGVALPQLYLLSDLEASRNSHYFMPFPLKTINGRDASEYLD
ncbi:uncharacterized protein BCR38DRAFT_501754 [Pseudomassariella vexata]|uniref:CPAF-like PDZ domain-containing protein n=1 Tax=Pseudomassariella vexata TaxID=1141098 RepID=A0A1Y2DE79_9PEZI|nr:uncharacterized protein BCR38DRAFT_501754 [Pseudomassariella vexata]ORY57426.1 hypothetical protein BCR38DRAFT_501754 [Pseudomassariella vexata]